MKVALVAVLLSCAVSCALCGCKKRDKGPAFQAVDLGAAAAHACALMKDGSIRCWGDQEGHFEGPAGANAIVAGAAANCVLAGGKATCWGNDTALASAAAELRDVVELGIGHDLACARFKNATVSCWRGPREAGSNQERPREAHFSPVPGLEHAAAIAVGRGHACALIEEVGVVRCWGANESGQLGDGTTQDRAEPVTVNGLGGVVQIAAGGGHTCAVRSDRTASCWGSNRFGQLGDGTRSDRPTPVQVAHLEAARALALGDGHSCARLEDGTLRCWGQNDAGQQTDGTHEDRTTPIMISGLFDVQQIALGDGTVCARMADGTLRCWGRNDRGQAGDGTRSERPVPVTVRW